jgi:hypothetical protein
MKNLTLSIDFDNTIVEEIYPDIGPLRDNAREVINTLYNEGHTIIINSCRSGIYEAAMEVFLIENEINFSWINCNTPDQIREYGRDCRKISADIYIDDKNLGGIPNWLEIYKQIYVIWNKKKA